MPALTQPPLGGLPTPITGSPLRWGRDLGIIGGVTALAGTLSVQGLAFTPFGVMALITGVVGGLLLGIEMPAFLESARHRIPLQGIALRCVAVGASLGAFIGLMAASASGEVFLAAFTVAGVAGALQFGWLWLPYTILTVLERPTWPVVVGACLVAPLLGPVALGLSRLAVALFL